MVFEGTPRTNAPLQFYASLFGSDSYANVAGATARTLAARFPDFALCNYVGGHIEAGDLARHEGLDRHAPVAVFHGFPTHAPEWFFEHPVRIGLFVCETDRILPEWVERCNRFDLVVVPSSFCRTAFLTSGVNVPIMVAPHGVHPEHYPRPGLRDAGRFVFYNTFRRQVADRKGYLELLRGFQAAFAGRDDVVLRLRAGDPQWLPRAPGWPDYGGLVEFDTSANLDMAGAATVYSQVHCTVHPSRGEGFGLVPLESIACATPVIAPAHSGMADYLTDDNALLLRHAGMQRAARVDHLCGRYYRIDEEHLVESLRAMPAQWNDRQQRLLPESERVRREYTWPNVLAPLLDILEHGIAHADRNTFRERVEGYLDHEEVARQYHDAEVRARFAPVSSTSSAGMRLDRDSIVYCGWDYPADGIGNHLRLLDRLVFDQAGIRYKSLEELPGPWHDAPDLGIASYLHAQRPDLFRGCLYLDVTGIHGDRRIIDAQIERVQSARRQFGAATAIYLMWESDRLWEPFVDLLHACDLVIVTTDLLCDDLQQRGIRHVVLPHPYEYEVQPPVSGGDPDAPLTIGVSAGLWPRKNVAALVEAFAEAIGDDARYRLRVHSRVVPAHPAAQAEYQAIRQIADDCPHIEFTLQSFTREQYLHWMRSLDLYCFVSAGEGWSVTPREALHLGKPVILLDAHAHRGFSHLPGVIRVPPGPPQPARPGMRFIDGAIGCEAGLDAGALRTRSPTSVTATPRHNGLWPRALTRYCATTTPMASARNGFTH
jgi:glycosyltransferase involved in cell wall biosynthesis